MNGLLTEVANDQLLAALQANECGVPANPRTTLVPCVRQESDSVRPLVREITDPLFSALASVEQKPW